MTTTEGERVTGAKEAAGRRAADMVETGTVVGLGTGSTVWFTLVRLAERIQTEGLEVVGLRLTLLGGDAAIVDLAVAKLAIRKGVKTTP